MVWWLEPEILKYKVKRGLGDITTNNATAGDNSSWAISNVKDEAVKVLHSICQ